MLELSSSQLNQYLERVGYGDNKEPTLKVLCDLSFRHMQHIPWDTLDLFGGPAKDLNLSRIFEDLVIKKRGGWCYEHNGLFGSVLKTLGYNVSLMEGSVYISKLEGFSSPFDHLLLKVVIDGKNYVVDVGCGALACYGPFLLSSESQTHMAGVYRIRNVEENEFHLERRKKNYINKLSGENTSPQSSKPIEKEEWQCIYKFSGTPRQWNDFAEACEKHQEVDAFFKCNSFLQIFQGSTIFELWGTKLTEREFVDPLTENVKVTELLPEVDPAMADKTQKEKVFVFFKEKFGVELDFWPSFKSKNFSTVI